MALKLSRAAVARSVPFAIFMVLLVARGSVPEDGAWAFDARWIYAGAVVAVAASLVWFWRDYGELVRQTWPTLGETALATIVGLAVFALWIHLDAPWMKLGEASAGFTPLDENGNLLWPLVVFRLIGAAMVVPIMEELFWRSFIMRWIQSPTFEAVPPSRVRLKAIVLSTFVFMLAHTLWLAAVIAGLAYALLYIRTGKLWVSVLAHAVTNAALGIWVIATKSWAFW
jgi:CAAX prenyl protease-like protein